MKTSTWLMAVVLIALPASTSGTSWDTPPPLLARFGSYGQAPGEFYHPHGLTSDDAGNLYVADTYNHRVQKLDSHGHALATYGSYGTGPGQLIRPRDVAVGRNGEIYVTDTDNHRVVQFAQDGSFVRSWGSHGDNAGQFVTPFGIAVDDLGSVYVTDWRVQKFTSYGLFLFQWGSFVDAPGGFRLPRDIDIGADGLVYVVDGSRRKILKFTPEGTFVMEWGDEAFSFINFLALDDKGGVWVTAAGANPQIFKFDGGGHLEMRWGPTGNADGEFNSATGIGVDHLGNVYVAQRVDDPSGTFGRHDIQKFGTGVVPVKQTTWGAIKNRYR